MKLLLFEIFVTLKIELFLNYFVYMKQYSPFPNCRGGGGGGGNSIPFPFIKWNDQFIVYTFVIQEQCGTYSVIVGSHSGQCLDHISCTKHVRTLVSRHRHIQEDNILTVLAKVLPRATTAFVIYGMSEDLQPHYYYTFILYYTTIRTIPFIYTRFSLGYGFLKFPVVWKAYMNVELVYNYIIGITGPQPKQN